MKIINHIGLSGGKDSTALWGWAILESGYPIGTIRGSFSDTENEYQEVYDQIAALDAFGKRYGVAPIKTLSSEGFLKLAQRKKRFPSARARFCTEVLKIQPMLYYLQELWLDGCEVILHSGVRGNESFERSLMTEWSEQNYCKLRGQRPHKHHRRIPQVKRSIDGTHHSVSRKYLQNYVDEFSFRYNRRFFDSNIFASMMERTGLTGSTPATKAGETST